MDDSSFSLADDPAAGPKPLANPSVTPRHATLVDALDAGARDDAPGFTLHAGPNTQRLGMRTLQERAIHIARTLQADGLSRGEIVPLLVPTSEHLLQAFLGVILAGGVPAPLATPMTFGSPDKFLERFACIVAETRARRAIVQSRLAEALSSRPHISPERLRVLTEASIAEARPTGSFRPPNLTSNDLAFVQYTSGTTGAPRGVCISHGAITANAASICGALRLSDRDVGVSWLPMHHDMGLVGAFLTTICHPYEVHLMRPESFARQPGSWLELLTRTGATVTVAPNFAYELAVQRTRPDAALNLSRLRVALSGAEPVRADTVERFVARFGDHGLQATSMTPVYGMAEATLAISAHPVGTPIRTARFGQNVATAGTTADSQKMSLAVSVGAPVPGVAVRILAPDGGFASEGAVGELEVKSPSLMNGYYRRSEETDAVLRDGWLRTGDLGFARAGSLFITGRAKDLIIAEGRNISPVEVEHIVSAATQVNACAAFAMPDNTSGSEALAIAVEAVARAQEDKQKLAKCIRAELLATLGIAPRKVAVVPIGSLPRTTSGKIRRGACYELLREDFAV